MATSQAALQRYADRMRSHMSKDLSKYRRHKENRNSLYILSPKEGGLILGLPRILVDSGGYR
jgi:hypothetical protein